MTKEETMKKFEEIFADFINDMKYANYYRESMDSGMEIEQVKYEQQNRSMLRNAFEPCKKNMSQEKINEFTQALKDDTKYRVHLTDIDYTIIDKNRKPINQGKVL